MIEGNDIKPTSGNDVNRDSNSNSQQYRCVIHGVDSDTPSNRPLDLGTEEPVVPVSTGSVDALSSMNTRSHIRLESATSGHTLDRQARSGPTSDYKYIGSCSYSCQYYGALFWYKERLRNNARNSRRRYNRCCMGGRVALQGEPPRFLQLYIYDTDNEVDNRMSHFGGDNSILRRDIVEGLIDMLDTHNALLQLFRTTHEKYEDIHVPNFKVRLYNVIGAREYELPTGDMLGAIVYEPGPEFDMDYDIVLEERFGYPQRVNKLQPSYMSLQSTNSYTICGMRNHLARLAVLYTVEFQKRGLPRCHTLLWIDELVRVHRDEDIDIYILVKLPSKEKDPECHRIVSELMMHRPCGLAYTSASCMQNSSRCKKNFPKEYCGRTYYQFIYRTCSGSSSKKEISLTDSCQPSKEEDHSHRMVILQRTQYRRRTPYLNFPSEFVWRLILSDNVTFSSKRLYKFLCTINDIVYPTCRAACEALGLLEDDREWETTLEEAAVTAMPTELQTLLAHILSFCQVSDQVRLWKRTWKSMSADIPYTSSISLDILDLQVDDSELEDHVLYELESCLNHCSKSLTDFGLRLPPEHLMSVLRNKLPMEEKCYDRQLLAKERDRLLPKLNDKRTPYIQFDHTSLSQQHARVGFRLRSRWYRYRFPGTSRGSHYSFTF
nr:helitron helicase-like domain-containing protein [Tanacetum cinerariifolium]